MPNILAKRFSISQPVRPGVQAAACLLLLTAGKVMIAESCSLIVYFTDFLMFTHALREKRKNCFLLLGPLRPWTCLTHTQEICSRTWTSILQSFANCVAHTYAHKHPPSPTPTGQQFVSKKFLIEEVLLPKTSVRFGQTSFLDSLNCVVLFFWGFHVILMRSLMSQHGEQNGTEMEPVFWGASKSSELGGWRNEFSSIGAPWPTLARVVYRPNPWKRPIISLAQTYREAM